MNVGQVISRKTIDSSKKEKKNLKKMRINCKNLKNNYLLWVQNAVKYLFSYLVGKKVECVLSNIIFYQKWS